MPKNKIFSTKQVKITHKIQRKKTIFWLKNVTARSIRNGNKFGRFSKRFTCFPISRNWARVNNKNEGDSTDGPLDFIENLVNTIQVEFDRILSENDDKKLFIKSLNKIFTILLSVKADSTKKIKQIC